MAPKATAVLVTVSGKDAPGITAELTGILARHQAVILDVAQAVIHGLLSLSLLFELDPADSDKVVLKDLVFRAGELGLKPEYLLLENDPGGKGAAKPYHYAVTLIAERISARALHEVT